MSKNSAAYKDAIKRAKAIQAGLPGQAVELLQALDGLLVLAEQASNDSQELKGLNSKYGLDLPLIQVTQATAIINSINGSLLPLAVKFLRMYPGLCKLAKCKERRPGFQP